jgi:hypothetical protein
VELGVEVHVEPPVFVSVGVAGGVEGVDLVVDEAQAADVGGAGPAGGKLGDQPFGEREHAVEILDRLGRRGDHLAADLGGDGHEAPLLQAVQGGHDGMPADAHLLADLLDQDTVAKAVLARNRRSRISW